MASKIKFHGKKLSIARFKESEQTDELPIRMAESGKRLYSFTAENEIVIFSEAATKQLMPDFKDLTGLTVQKGTFKGEDNWWVCVAATDVLEVL